jgi:serine/threonine protein kinase
VHNVFYILYSYNIIYNMQAKVIGIGSTGCVVHPAIPCTGKGTLRDKISKILPKTDASKEFDMIAELARLEQFAIFQSMRCPLNKTHEDNARIIRECKKEVFEHATPDDLEMLIYDYGGIDLVDYYPTLYKDFIAGDNINLFNFFYSLYNLFIGVHYFREKGIMHGDIRRENIVYNRQQGVSKFIDFGIMTSKSRLLSKIGDKGIIGLKEEIPILGKYYKGSKVDGIMPVAEIIELYDLVESRDDYYIEKIDLVINNSDIYALCMELNKYIQDLRTGLLRVGRLSYNDPYIIFLNDFVLVMELALCRETRNSVISIKDLCTKYQELMATNPFLSANTSASGYIKKKKNNNTIMRRNSKYRKRKSGKNKGTRRSAPPTFLIRQLRAHLPN